MSSPDAKRRSVAYVLVFCPTAEVLLDRKELHIHVTVEVPGIIILGVDREWHEVISVPASSQTAPLSSVSLICESSAWDRYPGERFQSCCLTLANSQAELAPLTPSSLPLPYPKKTKNN